MIIGDAFIAVKGDTKGFAPSTESAVLSSVRSTAKKAAVIFGAAFSAGVAVRGIQDAIAAGDESNKVAADTAQTIKTTGGAAKVTAAEVERLATALSLKTGVDDEAIQSSQNMLLTFTNLRNEVGRGNDIFSQASALAVDMGAKFKNGPEAASIQLGKALNNPIKGITALTRVGVTFTDEQKAQIKALQESGDLMGAQKIILAELQKEFGGVAEATATATDKIKVAFGNLQEGLGQAIAPAIEAIAPALLGVVDSLGPVVAQLGGSIGAVIGQVAPALGPLADALVPVIDGIGQALVAITPSLATAVGSLVPVLAPLGDAFAAVATAVAPLIVLIGESLGALLPPIVQGFTALVTAAAPLVQVFTSVVGTLVSALQPSMAAIADVLTVLADSFAGFLGELLAGDGFKDLMATISDLLVQMAPVVLDLAATIGGVLLDAFKAMAPVIVEVASAFVDVLAEVMPVIADLVTELVDGLVPILPKLVDLWLSIVEAMLPLVPVIVDLVKAVAPFVSQLIDALVPVLGQVIDAIVPLIPIIVDLAKQFAAQLGPAMERMMPSFLQLAQSMGDLLVALLPILEPLLKFATLLIEKIGVAAMVSIAESMAGLAQGIAIVADKITALVDAITGLDWTSIEATARDVFDKVVTFVTELPGRIVTAAGDLFGGIIDAASRVPGQVGEFLAQLPAKVLEAAAGLGLAAAGLGVSIIEGLVSGLGGLVEKAGDLASDLLDAVKSVGAGIINGVIDALNAMLPNRIGKIEIAGFTVFDGLDLPDNPIPRIELARGGLVRRRPGGVPAVVGEGIYDEAVVPLPSGLLEGLQALAAGPAPATQVASSGSSWTIEQLVLPPATPLQHARDMLDALDTAAWLQGVGT